MQTEFDESVFRKRLKGLHDFLSVNDMRLFASARGELVIESMGTPFVRTQRFGADGFQTSDFESEKHMTLAGCPKRAA